MMKKQTAVTVLIMMALLGAHAENLAPRFERVRSIDGSFSIGERGRLLVPSDVFGQARNFPNDLRILSSEGMQWPYFLYVPTEGVVTGQLVPEILNRAFVPGDHPYLQFDLVIPQEGSKKRIHNQIKLKTTGQGFIRRVEVFTRHSEQPDGLMAVGHLIDFPRQSKARNRSVRYPDSDSDRLHVRIYSNAQNADEIFGLTSATLGYRAESTMEYETVIAPNISVPDREKEKHAQTYLFDLGEENRPVERLVFNVETPSFARSVSVYARNTSHDPWAWAGSGEIHMLEDDEQVEVKIHAKHRFIKVHVFHYDDAPLTIQSIQLEAAPRYLVFEAASEGPAGLYYRAWDLQSPHYDLKGRIETKALATLPIFQTLEAAPNEAASAQPWRKYSKWLGILAVGGVSLLVLGVIASMLKQQK